MTDTDAADVPDYEQQLSAFHAAFAAELEAMIAKLALAPTARVLDLACGDGFYTRRLAERLGRGGSVVGIDVDPAYLEIARGECASYRGPATIELVEASFDHLPFSGEAFDLVWCAQSLQSLPDPVLVLEHVTPVLRPGGMVAILENDLMHQVFLPWPVELELALREAELRAVAKVDNASKYYLGRRLATVFATAGLDPVATTTIAIDRQAPLGNPERTLLQSYLDELVERVQPFLDAAHLAQLRSLVDASSAKHLLRQPHLTMTWVNVLAVARRRD